MSMIYQLAYMVLPAVLFSHADGTKHKERLPKDTQISFFKCTEPSSSASTLLSNNAGDSSDASSSKQTVISICTNKQLVTKAEVMWVLDVCLCPTTCSIHAQIKVICFHHVS